MQDLEGLFRQLVVDHFKKPGNYGKPAHWTRAAERVNPLCGDRVKVYLRIEGGRVVEASFEGQGCAIATSSASMMTDAVKGKTEEEVEALSRTFLDMIASDPAEPADRENELGELAAFAGVREFPARITCATLCWLTLADAVSQGAG